MTAASGLKDTAPLPCDASSTFKVESYGRKIVLDTNQSKTPDNPYITLQRFKTSRQKETNKF